MRNFVVTVDGKQYSVQVEENGVAAPAVSAPVAAPAPVQKAAPAPAPKAAVSASGNKLDAPLPGMIIDFKVANGSAVKKGDVVLTLEAMKMENDVVAPCDGTINFTVSKGANVNTGDTLATIS